MRSVLVVALALLPLGARAAPDTVTILRDRYGVPHVFVEGPHGAERGAFADGYAQAEDRLFEMDVLRRAATGRLSEILGHDYLAMDQVARRDGYTLAERKRFFRRLSAPDRRALLAYRDGVNARIARVTADRTLLPVEFGGTPPARWSETDSVAVAALEIDRKSVV